MSSTSRVNGLESLMVEKRQTGDDQSLQAWQVVKNISKPTSLGSSIEFRLGWWQVQSMCLPSNIKAYFWQKPLESGDGYWSRK
jgi:hypothetical protein